MSTVTKFFVLGVLLNMASTMAQGQHAYVEQAVLDRLHTSTSHDLLPIVVQLSDVVDVQALKSRMVAEGVPVSERPRMVMQALKSKALATQPAVLNAATNSGLPYTDVRTLWIVNAISLKAVPELVQLLASMPEVDYIGLDRPLQAEVKPLKGALSQSKSSGGAEPGLKVIAAHELWQLGYTGHGRMALVFDTGVSPHHPSFKDRFLPNFMPLGSTWLAWFSDEPVDKVSQHGTHVSGIILGLDAAQADTIGVAFGASFIASDLVLDIGIDPYPWTYIDFFEAFQWALNPDGDESTSHDVPDVINNSWSGGVPNEVFLDCSPIVSAYFDAIEAAGIANVFAAGNNGPFPETIPSPGNTNTGLVNAFSVGAVDGNDMSLPIADFSSRGPSLCEGEGSLKIKPEVSAPGVNVRSSVHNNSYEYFGGTSMAAPHVSGAVLLLKEAFPFLSGEELLLALYNTAIDLGDPGEDNTYGMGIINVKAAFDYLSSLHTPEPPASKDIDLRLVSIDFPNTGFVCTPSQITPVPISANVENTGQVAVGNFSISYRINAGAVTTSHFTEVWLNPGEETTVALSPVQLENEPGSKELHVFIDLLPDEYDVFNNNAVHRWEQLPNYPEGQTDLIDDFENGLEQWTVINPDNRRGWDTAFVMQIDGSMGYAALMNLADYQNAWSEEDALISHRFITTPESFDLRFDYFYRRMSGSPSSQDTLKVYALSACGNERHLLWKRGGSQLWTVPVNGFNSLPANAGDWQSVLLNFDASEYPEADWSEGMFISFVTLNRQGNNVLIDNVQIGQGLFTQGLQPALELSVQPNPANDQVQFNWRSSEQMAELSFIAIDGRLIKRVKAYAKNAWVDTGTLTPGLYLVHIIADDGRKGTVKLVKH